jgi:hypothetical protein
MLSHPRLILEDVEVASSVRFSALAQALAAEARRRGLEPPGFRSPPRLPGVVRTIRRSGTGAVVAIRIRDREVHDVAVDMVDGVVVANHLDGDTAASVRAELLDTLTPGDVAQGQRHGA